MASVCASQDCGVCRRLNTLANFCVVQVGAGNGSPGLRGLQFSASVRYDDYSDQGGTTNPKFGVNYKPFNDLTIRGNWGTSFHAPSLADTTNTSDSRATVLPYSPFLAPGATPVDPARATIVLAGGSSMFSGFADRIGNEVFTRAPGGTKVRVIPDSQRKFASWIGGSMFASLGTFGQIQITKQEYDDCHESVVHRKCL